MKKIPYRKAAVLIAVLLGICAGILSYTEVFSKTDRRVTDWVYDHAKQQEADSRITILAVDEKSIEAYGEQDTWSRSIYAHAIEKLTAEQAAVVGLDLDLTETGDDDGDAALEEACSKAGNVVAAASAVFDICVNSDDPLIFAASDKRVHQSMDIAQELGVRAVIFHTNHIANFRLKSYREGWVKRNTAYWEKILREYPDSCIYIENMFDEEPELLLRLAENMQGEDHFGVCLDLAHAYLSGTPLEEWERQLKPYVKHLHINDNDRQEDTHQPVGSAGFPWQNYKTFLETFPEEEKPSVLIEVRGYQDLAASVEYMQKEKLYPFTERAL